MLTPNQVLKLSEPVEKMYIDCVSQLIINIASHFKNGRGLETQEWQIKKLSELGQLTRESAEIIAKNTGEKKEVIIKTLEEAVGVTLEDMEKNLKAAAKAGKIEAPGGDVFASDRVREVLTNYTAQAESDLNLVNTTMLQSTAEAYRTAITNVVQYENAQAALNAAAGRVNLSTATHNQAVREAIKKMAEDGLTGFIDRAGRKWSPEAYVNMDVRTTVHNTAVQSQKARSADYGVYTFQVTVKRAARPLCAPYQGKFYSWDNSAGVIEDLYGRKYRYSGINTTSFGEPAGLFGINCGHDPVTFVPGYNVPRYEPLSEKQLKENEAEYKLSQKQRHFERQTRKAKTEALAYDAAGDKEAFDKAAMRVKEKTAAYKAFCKENNLTPRLDRLQVVGYNRSAAAKVTQAARRYNPQNAAAVKAVTGARITNIYGKPAREHAARYYGLVRSMKTDVDKISTNTGYDKNSIQKIKDFLFYEKHDLGGNEPARFYPDFAIAQSWQRLISGDIEQHDITLIEHELLERELMKKGMSQNEAHILASRQYNYEEGVTEFYANIKKHKNKK